MAKTSDRYLAKPQEGVYPRCQIKKAMWKVCYVRKYTNSDSNKQGW